MNVCIINEGRAFGGAEIHTLQLIRHLAQRGHEVQVIECGATLMEPRRESAGIPAAVRFLSLPLSVDSNNPADLLRWMRALRLPRPAHGILIKNYFRRGWLPFLFALRKSCERVSYVEHLEALPAPPRGTHRYLGVLPPPGLWRYRDRLRRSLPAAFCDNVVAVSGKVRDVLISDCGYPEKKITVARNGVNHQYFRRDPQVGARYREALRIPPDRLVVAILARLEHAKGLDVALDAIALASRLPGVPRIHLVIAGTGSLENDLKAQAQSLGLSESINFVGFLADPRPLLWAADCILYSSRLEGLPLGLLEGMAAGCVPVVTRVSGMPEVVTSPDLGWVVGPEDAHGLAAALAELAALDEQSRAGFSRRVVAHIQENFDLTVSQDRLVEQLDL